MAKEDKKKSDVQEAYDKKAEQSRNNLLQGGETVKINMADTTLVRFTKDYGFIKKGHVQRVSDVAYEIYADKKVIEKV